MSGDRFPDWFGPWVFDPGSVTDLLGLALNLLVLSITVWVAWRQFRIMNRQTAMMETQDRIIKTQLLRRGVLRIALGPSSEPSAGYAVRHRVKVVNGGDKTVANYYWEVLCTQALLDQSNISLERGIVEHESATLEGVTYRTVQRHADFPVYPNIEYDLGFIEVRSPLPEGVEARILWRLHCEDGSFPEDANYGTIDIPMPAQTD